MSMTKESIEYKEAYGMEKEVDEIDKAISDIIDAVQEHSFCDIPNHKGGDPVDGRDFVYINGLEELQKELRTIILKLREEAFNTGVDIGRENSR